MWKWQCYCCRGKVHCNDLDVDVVVIIVRVGVICKDVLGRGRGSGCGSGDVIVVGHNPVTRVTRAVTALVGQSLLQ